jgi:hypothetical protein
MLFIGIHGGVAGRAPSVRGGLVLAQSGAGGDEVEDLDHLGAQRADEEPVAAGDVLAGDAALLVGGGA